MKCNVNKVSRRSITILLLSIAGSCYCAAPSSPSISLSKTTIALGDAVTVTAGLADTDSNLSWHDLYRAAPGEGLYARVENLSGWSDNSGTAGVPSGSSTSTISGRFTPWTVGTWTIHSNGHDGTNWNSTGATALLTVVNNTAPIPGSVSVTLLRLNESGNLVPISSLADNLVRVGDTARITATATDAENNLFAHNILINRPGITGESTDLENRAVDIFGNLDPNNEWHKFTQYRSIETAGWNHLDWKVNRLNSLMALIPAMPVDIGNNPPMLKSYGTAGISSSTRTFDFVLDAPGAWQFVSTAIDTHNAVSIGAVYTASTVLALSLPSSVPTDGRFFRSNNSQKLVGAFYHT